VEGTAEFAANAISAKQATPKLYHKTLDGVTVSSIGIGTYLGARNEHTDRLVTNAIIASVQSGWNVIDTAVNYRHQRGERSVGAALKQLFGPQGTATDLRRNGGYKHEQIFVATKAGFLGMGDLNLALDLVKVKQARKLVNIRRVVKSLPPQGMVLREAQNTEAIEQQEFVLTPVDIVGGKHCIAPACLKISLTRSLANMGVESVDLLYLHNAAGVCKSLLTTLPSIPQPELVCFCV
jgi:aryl-alcohol dehydrogenase-like predicted oxidoreductase